MCTKALDTDHWKLRRPICTCSEDKVSDDSVGNNHSLIAGFECLLPATSYDIAQHPASGNVMQLKSGA